MPGPAQTPETCLGHSPGSWLRSHGRRYPHHKAAVLEPSTVLRTRALALEAGPGHPNGTLGAMNSYSRRKAPARPAHLPAFKFRRNTRPVWPKQKGPSTSQATRMHETVHKWAGRCSKPQRHHSGDSPPTPTSQQLPETDPAPTIRSVLCARLS